MIRTAAIAAMLLFPATAFADQTVVYRGQDGKDLTLEIADSGAVHVSGPVVGQDAVILDGELYLVDSTQPSPRVMRIRDLAAAMEETVGPLFKGLFDAAAKSDPKPDTALVIEPDGTATVAGFVGERYRVRGLDDSRPDQPVEWVASRDPTLVPAGKAMQQFIEATMVMAAPFLGDAAAGMIGEMRQAFALGTPLKAGGKFELVSLKAGGLDAARFTLPAAPVSVADIVREMKAGPPTAQ